MDLCSIAKGVLEIEAEAITRLLDRIDHTFISAVKLILSGKGRVVVTGIGKSGIIGEKISATLSSTGTPSFFLHPTEGVHGDLGMVTKDDIVIAISNSGRTEEINQIIPSLKRIGVQIIALCGDLDSPLARNSDIVLDVSVEKEACPLGLAPTASTTATLAMGDALTVALFKERGLTEADFALLHPGGLLGKQLLLKVSDLMHTGDKLPKVSVSAPIKEVILEMSRKKLGMTCVTDQEGKLTGIITDGDLRRLIEKGKEPILNLLAEEAQTRNPKTTTKETQALSALRTMEDFSITSLVIVDNNQMPEGIIHIHDILRAGLR
ncbi:KpsF/GutQ family sugar-phosphate isomerase [bacterium]|nr:KpsF/GutQ family sugar-phosphate isomerase [bacterium]MBU1599885.1 KpsF/GutQ family sugar-phosphate isomerase [bacterium]MBU2461269.1 KpsF/GutQ family sugar-phosphate isomerase [bacterium]